LSFNDEGYVSPDDLRAQLLERGVVREVEIPYRRYVGARIGIYNPQGEKVGTPGRLVNVERLFVVTERPMARRTRSRRRSSAGRRAAAASASG
jgi:adenine-specific DNA-methyltransferase